MKMQKLSHEINQIEMPEEMKNRIMQQCSSKMKMQNSSHYVEMERKTMRKNKKTLNKPMVAAASLALCFCIIGGAALAASEKLEGYFKDIVRWDGAVVGTSYEQATDEINISVVPDADELIVTIEMLKFDAAPYAYFDNLGIGTYKITDENGTVVMEGEAADSSEIMEGKADCVISIDKLPGGNYKLVISGVIGSAKAEQPLVVNGIWECDFTR